MKATCLASSSAGNCYILELRNGGRTTPILVECGLPWREIISGMTKSGISVGDIQACLVTHYHGDHSKSIKEVAKAGITVFTHRETINHCGASATALEEMKPTKIADGVWVLAFPVKHDAEGSLGFIIKTCDETILFVNDCKMWEANLSGFKPDYVFIECNYWEKQVYAQINELHKALGDHSLQGHERVEFKVKIKQLERNVNAHMSLAGCIRSLKKLDLSRCIAIFLMHMSDGNANEYEMKTAVESATGVRTLVCKKKGGIK